MFSSIPSVVEKENSISLGLYHVIFFHAKLLLRGRKIQFQVAAERACLAFSDQLVRKRINELIPERVLECLFAATSLIKSMMAGKELERVSKVFVMPSKD